MTNIFPPLVPNIASPPTGFRPMTNVVPFTARSGATFQEELYGFIGWVNESLVPYLNTEFPNLADSWKEQVDTLFAQVDAALDAQAQEVDDRLQEALTAIINSTIAITDPVVQALVNSGPLTIAALDAKYSRTSAIVATFLSKADAIATYLPIATAASTYLTIATAASTYLTSATAASTYLTQANAASTYLTQANAASTYLKIAPTYGFNISDTTLGNWRGALRSAAGSAVASINFLGDSIFWGSGSGSQHNISSIPSRVQRMFEEVYGKQTPGMLSLWPNYGNSGTASEQGQLSFNGLVENGPFGSHQLGSKKLTVSDSVTTYVNYERVWCDGFEVMFISGSSGQLVRVFINDVDKGTIKAVKGATGNTITSSDYSGYAPRQVVSRITAPTTGYNTIRLVPEGTAGWEFHLASITPYTSFSRGVVAHNNALSGITTVDLVKDDPAYGQYGMAVSIDYPRSPLNVIEIGINDYQGHYPVAEFKARLVTAIRRCKSTSGAGGVTKPAGDVLLVVTNWVDTTRIPADHSTTPSDSLYMAAVREAAVEENAAGLDLRAPFANWTAWANAGYDAGDGLHQSITGNEFTARELFKVLALPREGNQI